MTWLEAVVAAPARTIMPQAPYIPNAPQTLPSDPEPLAKAKAKAEKAPAAEKPAAGGSKFKEYLHIRGADGKFITKGGIVNVTGADGKVRRGRVQELTEDGPVVRYDDGDGRTQELVPLADATSRIAPAPKAIARISTVAARSTIRTQPYEVAKRWEEWQQNFMGTFDRDDPCTQDAAEMIRTGELPAGGEGGCIGPADGKLGQFLQRVHREGAAALIEDPSIGDDERAVAFLGAKLLGYNTRVPSGPKPKPPPKPKKAPKAKKPAKAKKAKAKKWDPWGG